MIALILLSIVAEAKIGFLPKNISESELDTAIPLLYCLSDRHSMEWEIASHRNYNLLLTVSAKQGEVVIEFTKDGQAKTFSLQKESVEEICAKLSPIPLGPVEKIDSLPTSSPQEERKIKAWHIGAGAAVLGLGAYLLLSPKSAKHSSVVLE